MNNSFLRIWWLNHGTVLMRCAVLLMAVLALLKLGDEFRRLVCDSSPIGAIDLKMRHEEVLRWFAGEPVYKELKMATYPPASYAILWPLIGWLPLTSARWLWAGTSLVSLVWLTYLIIRESGASIRLERFFVALILLSMNATGVAIGNGQLTVPLLPMLLVGLILLHQNQSGWPKELLAVMLLLVTLVKPNVSIPFFWIAIFASGKLRPTIAVGLSYIALTFIAVSFQEVGFVPLIRDWISRPLEVAVNKGYAHLPIWLITFGLKKWILLASFFLLAALGIWTYCHRHVELCLLIGITALAARFWTYHGLYDDVLILFPMVSLFRIAKFRPFEDRNKLIAGLLLAISVLTMLIPARLHYFWPPPWPLLFSGLHVIVWTVVLVFLLNQACLEVKEKR